MGVEIAFEEASLTTSACRPDNFAIRRTGVMAGEIAMRDGSKFPRDIDSEPARAPDAAIKTQRGRSHTHMTFGEKG